MLKSNKESLTERTTVIFYDDFLADPLSTVKMIFEKLKMLIPFSVLEQLNQFEPRPNHWTQDIRFV